MASQPQIPSFRLRKEIKTDRIDAGVLETPTYHIELAFTGAVTETVTGTLSQANNLWSLTIPAFSEAVGVAGTTISASIPTTYPLPALLAGQSHPVSVAGAAEAGYITLSNAGALIIHNYSGNFTGVSGLIGDVVFQYKAE